MLQIQLIIKMGTVSSKARKKEDMMFKMYGNYDANNDLKESFLRLLIFKLFLESHHVGLKKPIFQHS